MSLIGRTEGDQPAAAAMIETKIYLLDQLV